MREQNALPRTASETRALRAKDAIDNGGAGRAAKGAIPIETHQTNEHPFTGVFFRGEKCKRNALFADAYFLHYYIMAQL